MAGPLSGVRIVEMAGIGPAPFAGMMLADHGAEVIRVERPAGRREAVLGRSRRSIAVDLKSDAGAAVVRRLAARADGLIEGLRPGVMERWGLGPEVLLGDNPRLVYGRMTGWGQTGPWAQAAGHDINFIALAGALHAFGRAGEKPTPPINLVGDFGGGGMLLAFGMAAALLHAARTGDGQVVDAAMTDGAALLMSMIWGFLGAGFWKDQRGVNLLDSGAPFYDTYECAGGGFIAIGSIEPQFYTELRARIGLADDPEFDAQMDSSRWPVLRERLSALFRTRTREEWCRLMDNTDVCFAPVLTMTEAPAHPHNAARETFVKVDGLMQPAPAPRYSQTPAASPSPAPGAGADTDALLAEAGYSGAEIAGLRAAGAVR